MAGNLYDLVFYSTHPRLETHPDRLAAAALLFGLSPMRITNCRLLEIGCGDGGNLIPMAYSLPHSRFVGVDLAEEPIRAARGISADLQLDNLTVTVNDLREIGAEWGEFDYIVAHGLYSWTPEEVRDSLMRVCGERLAPGGVAMISYNVWPGCCVRQALRAMLLYHTSNESTPGRRIEAARMFLEELKETATWNIDGEVERMLGRDSGSLFHDDLAEINQPVYFHQFAAHAARNGLQYLTDADRVLGAAGTGNRMDREQYADFRTGRGFRYSILCREDEVLNEEPGPGLMDQFLFSASMEEREEGELEGMRGVRIAAPGDRVRQVASALGEVYPLPLRFDELVPYAGGEQPARETVFALVQAGFADLHVYDFPCEETVTERPRASRLARYQCEHSLPVTSARHLTADLDDESLRLLALLDGTRTAADLLPEFGEALHRLAGLGLLEG